MNDDGFEPMGRCSQPYSYLMATNLFDVSIDSDNIASSFEQHCVAPLIIHLPDSLPDPEHPKAMFQMECNTSFVFGENSRL